MIGHEVLLAAHDSTSRVLPILREQDHYKIEFASEFEFKPNELVALIDRVVNETNLASSYIVEVAQCTTGEVVYSFRMDDLEQSIIIPCGTRIQPKACYTILFTLLAPSQTNDLASPLVSTNPPNTSNSSMGTFEYGAVVVVFLLVAGFLFYLHKRKKEERDPNLIPLGEFHFDKRNTELLINQDKIELTSKEADLLSLLYETVNTTVEREVILNKVWGDQGGYVGRTLDVFVSKLRKKLEADSSVKITNIRGVGYKLVMKV